MAFDDVTLFELHFDGATIGTPGRDADGDDVTVTDPDRMVTDPDRMTEDESVGMADVKTDEAASERSSPSRGRRVLGVAAVLAAAVGARALYRRRVGGEGAAPVAVESADHDDAAPEPVEQ